METNLAGSPADAPNLTLEGLLRALRRRWPIIVVGVLLGTLLGLVYSSLQTPRYRSTARILVDQGTATIFDPTESGANSAVRSRSIGNELEFLRSDDVAEAVQQRLGEEREIRATASSDTDVLAVTAEADSPVDASETALAWSETYIEQRRLAALSEYASTTEILNQRIAEIDAQLSSVGDDTAEASFLRSQRNGFEATLQNLTISAELTGAGFARIITRPEPAKSPFAPQPSRLAIIGAVFGLVLSAAAIILLDIFDRSIASKERIEAVTGVSNLATIPRVVDWREHTDTYVVAIDRPNSREAEAYRNLRASVDFVLATSENTPKLIQVTSANPGEGKTTTTVNLAITLARAGKVVALVDGDLRRPRLNQFFDIPREPGLTTALVGACSVTDAVQLIDNTDRRLGVVPSGQLPPGPSEVLGAPATRQLLDEIGAVTEVVLIDSAPVLPVSDAVVLASVVDATIVVANAARTDERALSEAMTQLRTVDSNIIGTVLNEVSGRGSGYGYGYGYGAEEQAAADGSLRNRVRKAAS